MFLRTVSVAASPHHEVAHGNAILLDVLQVVVVSREVAAHARTQAGTHTHQIRVYAYISVNASITYAETLYCMSSGLSFSTSTSVGPWWDTDQTAVELQRI